MDQPFHAGEEEAEWLSWRKRAAMAFVVGAHLLGLTEEEKQRKKRIASRKRDREGMDERIMEMPDAEFQRMYRLSKDTFVWVLRQILPDLEKTPEQLAMAQLSCKEEVTPTVALAIALRFAAGGSYLDLAFGYRVATRTVFYVYYKVFEAIDKRVDNINCDLSEENMKRLNATFYKYGKGQIPHTVLAGDGVVFRMKKPSIIDADGNVTAFFVRKGYYAYGLQAFCDGDCKFHFICTQVCSSTHDSTAYIYSGLSKAIKEGKLPKPYNLVLDNAYACGEQEFTPWKGKNLSPAKDAFNYFLSLQRQCIERAFGMLYRCWGILWRPLMMNFQHIELTLRVLCKLHNLRVDDCLRKKRSLNVGTIAVHAEDIHWRKGSKHRCRNVIDTPLYTDGTNGNKQGQGCRNDLEYCPSRDELTKAIRSACASYVRCASHCT